MDEITLFAELRPNETLGDAELAGIRAELFPGLEPNTPLETPADDTSGGELLEFRHTTEDITRHRRSRVVLVAAAAVVLLGVGGLWVTADRDGQSNPLATANQPTAATPDPAAQTPTPASVPSTPVTSLPLCTDAGCAGFDPLAVSAGAPDFYLGPESLGDPIVDDDLFETLTRCTTLSADFASCDKIEGIAGVNLVSYPLDATTAQTDQGPPDREIRVGTTFTDLDPSTYATQWGPTQGNGTQTDSTVRGHAAIRYSNEVDPAVVWQERPGVLVWVTVPADRTDELMSIAEGVRLTDGPTTIPNRAMVTELAEPWDAWDNDGDGLIVATSAGQECIGLDYVETCGTTIEDRTIVRVASDGTTAVAGSTPTDVTSIRITVTGNDPIEINTIPFANNPSRYYSTVVPAGAVEAITWINATQAEVDTYTPTLTAADSSDATQIYTTIEGDTLAAIAQQFGFPAEGAELIAGSNGWTGVAPNDPLEPGTAVMIPPAEQPAG